ncbi:MAG: ammonia-forming cytochrome c nitrite reductase subunit c552 [Verrucomicrobia bacterium]|nr:ammonia-forming cytochrome c nitrite reductase subunit c552 [Verrucomicrobiota bacterium]
MNLSLDRAAFHPPHSFKHGTQSSDARMAPNGRYEIVTMSLKGERQVFSPERVIGVEPLRQFLVTAPGGRLQVTEASYDPRSNQWFNVYGEEDRQPGEWGHWTGRGMNWNMMCAYCHNTAVQKNYRAATDSYATSMVEMGVGCESCHGPMADHVQWQRPRPQPAKGDPTLRKFSQDQMRDTCATCHARRSELTGTFRVGDDFFDHYGLVIPDETDTYYPDGQIRDEDYEFAAFLGSRMHFSGVRCGDCHSPHSAKNTIPNQDDLCLRCHAGPIPPAPKIDAKTHSFHKPGTSGDHCVDCHMPQTVYMQRHWRRDHGFTVPDPLLTKELGIPNACTRCHKDKSVDWAIDYADKWYGQRMERPARARTRLVAQARAGRRDSVGGLTRLAREEPIPYWRAVATLLLRRWVEDAGVQAAIVERAQDTNALVRTMAARALDALAGQGVATVDQTLARLLNDPSRAVRIDAAWALRRTLDTNSPAGQDLLAFLENNADQPTGLLQKGVFLTDRGDHATARPLFQTAVKWDAFSAPLRSALAVSLSTEGRLQEALTELETACKLAPRDAECRFKLALTLSELNRLTEATAALEETVKLEPEFARAWYNLGLAHAQRNNLEKALEALTKAEALEPGSAPIPYARATILARQGRNIEARAAARKALDLQPNHAEAAALLQSLPAN